MTKGNPHQIRKSVKHGLNHPNDPYLLCFPDFGDLTLSVEWGQAFKTSRKHQQGKVILLRVWRFQDN